MEPAIRVTDLWKCYDGIDQEGCSALQGADMEVAHGELVALYGKSGSGKTTLLNLLAGLDHPTRGRIQIIGRDLETLGEKGRTRLRRRKVGFVFQFFNLLPTLNTAENVFLSLELAGNPDFLGAVRALKEVGLEGKEGRYPHELSGGEQQRVAIARALVKEPAIILADEPTGNLDTRTGDLVLELLSSRCRQLGATLIMATHSSRTSFVADRILQMTDGVISDVSQEEMGS